MPPVLSLIALVAGLNHIDLVLTVYAGSYTVCCVLGLGLVAWDWRHVMVDRFVAAAATAEPLPTLWVTARPFLVIEMVQVSLLSAPVLMLGVVGDPASVSAFSIVSRLTMLINTILISVAMIAAPAFASHHRRQEYQALRTVDRNTRMVAMAICLPVIGGLVVFVHPLLSLMGSNVSGADLALFVLMAGRFVNTLLPTQDMILSMTGHGGILAAAEYLQQLLPARARRRADPALRHDGCGHRQFDLLDPGPCQLRPGGAPGAAPPARLSPENNNERRKIVLHMMTMGLQGLDGSIQDICVVGAGPVGIALALELARRGRSVLLLESGDSRRTLDAQLLSDAEIADTRVHVPMDLAVHRGLGGASNLWGGRCVALNRSI